jgi:hypothetical protein
MTLMRFVELKADATIAGRCKRAQAIVRLLDVYANTKEGEE